MEAERALSARLGKIFPLVLSLGLVALGYMAGGDPEVGVRIAGVAGGLGSGIAGSTQAGPVAFVDVHVIPMDSERILENQTVLVSGGLIRSIGPAATTEIPEGTLTISGDGRYLMPGLAEMHAHVPPGDRPAPGVLEDIMFLYLANGITTIRGMLGSPYQLELRDELISGQMMGPTLYAAAPSLNGNTAQTADEARTRVRQYAGEGYDLLKIHPGIQRDVWDAMAETAHEVGISFGGHVPADVGLLHALETGQTTVDHLDGFLEAAASPAVRARVEAGETVALQEVLESVTPAAIRQVVSEAVEAGVWVVPTSYLWRNLYSPVHIDSMLALPEMAYVSARQRDGWRTQKTRSGSEAAATARLMATLRDDVLAEANRQGLGILMGTDSPQLFNVPGFALHREIRVMEDAQLSPYEVLVSGTRNVATYVAEVLGQEGNFGVVKVGNRADLVLLDANPLENLDALSRRAGTMVRGRWMSGEDIAEGLRLLASRNGN